MADGTWPGRTVRNDHGGPLCAEVHRSLEGIYDRSKDEIAKAIVELLRSDEPIDQHVRIAMANALERDGIANADSIRLRLLLPDGGRKSAFRTFTRIERLQKIAAEYRRLETAGLVPKQIHHEMRSMAGRTLIREALNWERRARFRVNRVPR